MRASTVEPGQTAPQEQSDQGLPCFLTKVTKHPLIVQTTSSKYEESSVQ